MELIDFWKSLSLSDRELFASKCGTTFGHLNNVAYGHRSCGEDLAINIDRESDGKVPVETTRPDVDWAYLRGTTARPVSINTGTHG